MLRLFLFVIYLSLFSTFSQNQIERGTVVLDEHPQEVTDMVVANEIDLILLRELTNFLTNRDQLYYNDYIIPKRKKAFMRHIKHLSEILEWKYVNKLGVNQESMELVYELLLFSESLKQASFDRYNVKKTFKYKVRVYKDTKRSTKVFNYTINDEAVKGPLESPFWHQVKNDSNMHKQFDVLAKLKKIKTKKRMVVLFDKLSYSGSAPKIKVLDLDLDNKWSLKWGDEVHTDVLGSRIFAALGYDVDHPYYYGEDKLTLVFSESSSIKNGQELIDSIQHIYKVDLRPFISNSGQVTSEMSLDHKKLKPFVGMEYLRFKKCAIEGRPDRVKRIGSIVPDLLNNYQRKELRAALLAHAFIGNWDTREENTCLTTVHDGNYNYRMSGIFSDLGTSFGVVMSSCPQDFKVGLVNELPWEVVSVKNGKVRIEHSINSILLPYEKATYSDLKWMAIKIGQINQKMLKKMIGKAGWPDPIAKLFFHKMASRRASILTAFSIVDEHPIKFDKHLTLIENGAEIVKDGRLIVDYKRDENPESFLSTKGRIRNYGN